MNSQFKFSHDRESPIATTESDASTERRNLQLLQQLEKALDRANLAASKVSSLGVEEEGPQLELPWDGESCDEQTSTESDQPLPLTATPPLSPASEAPPAASSKPFGPLWKPMHGGARLPEHFSLREALHRAETRRPPVPEFLRVARRRAPWPDLQPVQRDRKRPFGAPPASPGLPESEPIIQPGSNARIEAIEKNRKSSLLRIGTYAILASTIAGGIAFAIAPFIETQWLAVMGGEDAPGIATPGNGRPMTKDEPHLTLKAVSGAVNRPVALGIDVESPTPGSFVLVRGLPAGSRVTAGTQISDDLWRIPLHELMNAAITPPRDYIGTLTLPVDLRSSGDTVIASKVQRLTWVADQANSFVAKPVKTVIIGSAREPFPPVSVPAAIAAEEVAPAGSTQLAASEQPATPSDATALQPSRRIDSDELKNLLQRAESALDNGDFAAARLLLRRAAEGGNAEAARALAATYDPEVLKQLGALGAQADINLARDWYNRAADRGSAEARHRLTELQ